MKVAMRFIITTLLLAISIPALAHYGIYAIWTFLIPTIYPVAGDYKTIYCFSCRTLGLLIVLVGSYKKISADYSLGIALGGLFTILLGVTKRGYLNPSLQIPTAIITISFVILFLFLRHKGLVRDRWSDFKG